MANVVIVGTQWGDEGQCKIIDILSEKADCIARFQGGNNAGHTIVIKGKQIILHLIPSGILHRGKVCLIGNGLAVDPKCLLEEMKYLESMGIDLKDRFFRSVSYSPSIYPILPVRVIISPLRICIHWNASSSPLSCWMKRLEERGFCWADSGNEIISIKIACI